MFARVLTTSGPIDRFTESIKMIEERVIPGARLTPGFAGGYWLADRGTGKQVTIILWATEEALLTAEERVVTQRERAAAASGSAIVSVETFEVIAQASAR